jgi:SulP family sulfate permease
VGDVAEIPAGIPSPELPDLSLALDLVLPALSLAFVAMVQGAAISQSVPNPDGEYPDVSGDFRGQGVANLVAGVFRGMPVGGSMSATGLLTAAGARSRWANLVAAVVMLLVVLFFSGVASMIAMPALAGLLTVVGIRTFRLDNVLMVWRTGVTQASVMALTFVLTIAAPLQVAVLTGVGISIVLFAVRQSNKVVVHRWLLSADDSYPREVSPPAELEADEVVVLTTYGSLFFASAPTFEGQLPRATANSRRAVVVIRLRGKEDLGSTFIGVISRYQRSLESRGAFLVLAGVSDRVERQLRDTGAMELLGEENVFRATESVGESLNLALGRADALRASSER